MFIRINRESTKFLFVHYALFTCTILLLFSQCVFATQPVPTYKSGCSTLYISSVKISNQLSKVVMDNTIGNKCGTAISTAATLQASYGGMVTVKSVGIGYLALYIDWNRDGYLNKDVNEFYYIGLSSTSKSAYISVPAGASGSYVMRVVAANQKLEVTGGSNIGFDAGETEVYNLNIIDCTPTITIPSKSTAYCAGTPVLLNGSGAGIGGQHIWNASDGGSGTFTPVNKADSVVNAFLKGNPTVSLTVINKDSTCRSSYGIGFTMNPSPYPVTVEKPNKTSIFNICSGSQTTLTAKPYGKDPLPIEYQWYQEENGLLKGRTFDTLNASQPGRYFVRANLKGYNCGFAYSDTVTVNLLKSPTITLSSPNLCAGTAKLTATAPTNALYGFIWYADNGKGFVTDDKYKGLDTYIPSQDGKYYATANDKNFQCLGISPVVDIVTPVAAVQVKPGGNCTFKPDTLAIIGPKYIAKAVAYEWYDNSSKKLIAKGNTFIPMNSGSYDARIFYADGCLSTYKNVSNTVTKFVSPNLSPKNVVQCTSAPVTFTVRTDSIQQIEWFVGTTSVGKGTTYTSPAGFSGKIYAKALVLANNCPTTDSTNVTLLTTTKDVITAKGSFCDGNSVVLSSSIGTGLSYVWKKDGSNFTPAIVGKNAISISTSGIYTVDVVIDAKACSTSSDKFVANFKIAPTLTTTLSNVTICEGNSFPLTASAVANNPSFQWFDKGVLVGEQATFMVSDSGRFKAKVIDMATGCASPLSKEIIVTKILIPTPTISAVGSCLGQNTGFKVSPQLPTSAQLSWFKDNVLVSSVLNFVPAQSGIYNLSYTTSTCTSALSNKIYITPELKVQLFPSDTSVCKGSNVVNIKAISAVGKLNYQWTPTGPTTSTYQFNPNQEGYNVINVFATDPATNCTAFASCTLRVIPNNLKFNISNRNVVCYGGLGLSRIVVNNPIKGVYNYTWNDNPITTSRDSLALKSGTYKIRVVAPDGCAKDSSSAILEAIKSNLSIIPKIANPSCKGAANGSIAITIGNNVGTPKISWNIANKVDSLKISNLSANTYIVDVKDSIGCASLPVTLLEPSLLMPGSISDVNSPIILGTFVDSIRQVLPASGGNVPISLGWEMSNNCTGQWSTISQIKPSLSIGILQNSRCYRRVARNGCNETVYSNIVSIIVNNAAIRDSAFIYEGGELGSAIKLDLYGTAPWTVILKRVDGQIQGADTLKSISVNPYVFIPSKIGTYIITKVNGNLGRGSGFAVIYPKLVIDNSITTALMSGGGVLGSEIQVKFVGSKKFPLQYTYVHKVNQIIESTFTINDIQDSIITFTPDFVGTYEGKIVVDKDDKTGVVSGSAIIDADTIVPNGRKPTANIAGGGLIGSQITITIEANGVPAPWRVLVGLDYDSAGVEVKASTEYTIDKSPYSYPSKRAGTYRIKAVNENYDGNGMAIVYIEDRDSSEVFVWNAVSPNGDGKNDLFKIEIPTRLVNTTAKIVIFDREGTILSDLDIQIDNNLLINDAGNMFTYFWDCRNDSGELLNPGSYFFSFKVKGFENDKRASKSGFIELRR